MTKLDNDVRPLATNEIDAVAGGVWIGLDGKGCIRFPELPWNPIKTVGSVIRRILGWF